MNGGDCPTPLSSPNSSIRCPTSPSPSCRHSRSLIPSSPSLPKRTYAPIIHRRPSAIATTRHHACTCSLSCISVANSYFPPANSCRSMLSCTSSHTAHRASDSRSRATASHRRQPTPHSRTTGPRQTGHAAVLNTIRLIIRSLLKTDVSRVSTTMHEFYHQHTAMLEHNLMPLANVESTHICAAYLNENTPTRA